MSSHTASSTSLGALASGEEGAPASPSLLLLLLLPSCHTGSSNSNDCRRGSCASSSFSPSPSPCTPRAWPSAADSMRGGTVAGAACCGLLRCMGLEAAAGCDTGEVSGSPMFIMVKAPRSAEGDSTGSSHSFTRGVDRLRCRWLLLPTDVGVAAAAAAAGAGAGAGAAAAATPHPAAARAAAMASRCLSAVLADGAAAATGEEEEDDDDG